MVVVEVAGTQKVADPRAWGGDCDKDRMMSVAEAGVELMTATYDTSNLRSSLKEGATERLILKDGVEEMAEYDAANVNTRLARYDHDPSRIDGLLSQTANGVKTYFVTDALGSVYAAVQEDGTVAHRASYDASGAKTETVAATGTPWGFTGRRHDSIGLNYHRARYLDPAVGRWTSSDPIGEGHNWYAYALQSPTNMTDHSGLYASLVLLGDLTPMYDNHGAHDADRDFDRESFGTAVMRGLRPHVMGTFDDGVMRANDIILERVRNQTDALMAVAVNGSRSDITEVVFLGHALGCPRNRIQDCLKLRQGGVYINAKEIAELLRLFGNSAVLGTKIIACFGGEKLAPAVAKSYGPPVYGPSDRVTYEFEHTGRRMDSIVFNVPRLVPYY